MRICRGTLISAHIIVGLAWKDFDVNEAPAADVVVSIDRARRKVGFSGQIAVNDKIGKSHGIRKKKKIFQLPAKLDVFHVYSSWNLEKSSPKEHPLFWALPKLLSTSIWARGPSPLPANLSDIFTFKKSVKIIFANLGNAQRRVGFFLGSLP